MRTTPRPRTRTGFTLVEVVVAVLVLTVGLLGMAGSSAAIVRWVAEAALQQRADASLRQRVEWLAALSCGALTDGSARDGVLEERWRVRVDSAAGAAEVRAEVAYPTPGPRRTVAYETVVPC